VLLGGAAVAVIGAVLGAVIGTAVAQNTNPQPDFASQVMAAGPSVYLNYNDATASFQERVTGAAFQSIFTSTAGGPSGDVGWWPLNEGSGTSALDKSGNAATGTWNGTATCSGTYYTSLTNIAPYAGCFDGATDYVDLGATSQLNFSNTQAFSVAIWMRATTFGTEETLMANMVNAAPYQGWSIDFGNGVNQGILVYFINNITGNYISTFAPRTLDDGGWHLIVVTVDGSSKAAGVHTYIDGALQTSSVYKDALTATTANSGTHQTIGSRAAGGQPFTGSLNNAIVYNRALTATEVSGLYSEAKYGNPGPPALRQPGFDTAQPDNTSAGFPYNGFSVAPNSTLGSIEWDVPYSLLVHVDRLSWNRTGQLVLASKGDVAGATNYWELYLQMSGTTSQLCFSRSGGGAVNGVCTNSGFDAMPNGLNYDIVLTDAGTGAPGGSYSATGVATPLSLYINGLGPGIVPQTATSGSNAKGFGYVNLSVTGGTGYASSTNFTSTGGGAACSVTGTMLATNGVPASVTTGTGSNNFGCTSAPVITLVSPTGTGAVITATPVATSMNAGSLPLMLPGYVSGGTYNGVAGSNAGAGSTLLDEAAVFPGVLSQSEIAGLFDQTKFYQGLMKAQAQPPLVIVSEDGCGDTDNFFALSMLIKAHQMGAVKLIGVESVQSGWENPGFFREELDQAGLNHVPVSVSGYFDSSQTLCPAAGLTAYNASVPQTMAVYESSVTMYRTLFAEYPTRPIVVTSGGSLAGLVEFMQSGADGISGLTGTQLWAQNAKNGGAVYGQGLGENYSFGSYYDAASSEYMFANSVPMTLDWFGGTPQQAGPGVLASRTAGDPLWMVFHSLGGDTRPCWDCLTSAALMSNAFEGGVNVTIGGTGTGYAQYTPFTSTGGGAGCVVTGTMVSVNGVPSSILSSEGTALNTTVGTGTGCLTAGSPPTIVLTNPTGTGAVLTAATTASACGTITQTTASDGVTSQASCTDEYFIPYTLNAQPGATPVFEWFINSLVDPVPVGRPRRQ
jgi:hypothetical protein